MTDNAVDKPKMGRPSGYSSVLADEICARLAEGRVDAVIFLRDPMTPQPHEPDINALVRACDVHDVVCATNESSARHVMKALAAELDAQQGR